ncbi:MAG: cellulase [Gemmatimonadetes bacterium]|nr:cellulase [Gemmatimonadota bacterium]
MRRRFRVLVSLAVVAGSVMAILMLNWLSVGARGPLGGLLERAGAGVGSIEQGVRRRVSGPGRAGEMAWFERYRQNRALLQRPDSVLLGAYESGLPASLEGIGVLERTLGVRLPLIQVYGAWGDKPEQRFPLRVARAIHDYGSVPVITWEPWLTDFENTLHPELPLRTRRDRGGMGAVAAGMYDFYIDEWAAQAAAFGKPLYLRFGHEMNDPYRYPWGPQNNTKEQYIAAWRHVVDRFRAAGATNVLWVWSPHVAYEFWELYYPGADYVDWVATGALNYGPIAQWSQWWTFDQVFGTRYEALAAFGKPVMVAEFGSLAVGGDRAAWYRDALSALPAKYPAVKALLFFEVSGDQTVTYQKIDWTVAGDSAVVPAIRAAARRWAPGPVEGKAARR